MVQPLHRLRPVLPPDEHQPLLAQRDRRRDLLRLGGAGQRHPAVAGVPAQHHDLRAAHAGRRGQCVHRLAAGGCQGRDQPADAKGGCRGRKRVLDDWGLGGWDVVVGEWGEWERVSSCEEQDGGGDGWECDGAAERAEVGV